MKNKNLAIVMTTLWTTFFFASAALDSAEAGSKSFRPSKSARKAASHLTDASIRGHIRYLSDDLMGGRAPASLGDKLTQRYLASQFESIGLQPAGENGTWFQPFNMTGVKSKAPKFLTLRNGTSKTSLKFYHDFVIQSAMPKKRVGMKNAELVFVGYGIEAPEYQWDDYKGVDLKGKVLVFLNNDPAKDPNLFAGNMRLYYGRWTYKYEMAAKKGAVGAIILHTLPSAGYPWQVVQTGFSGEEFVTETSAPPVPVQGWFSWEAGEKVFKQAGYDLNELEAKAQTRDFKPVLLGTTMSVSMTNTIRNIETANVLGMLPGRDRNNKEVILYTSHHDHIGTIDNEATRKSGDKIYNGARDNASGLGGLIEIARAFTMLKKAPKRSILFVAVGSEENGLNGSSHLANNPTLPPGRIAANINMDSAAIWGRSRDITQIGRGKSSLDGYIDAVAKYEKRSVLADQFPDRGYFYRSDQFSFAKIGIPAVSFSPGTDLIGKPEGEGKQIITEWVGKHYHQPSDELKDSWDLNGAVDDFRFNFYLGIMVANAKEMPKWNPGDEFEAARLESLQALKN